MCHPHIISKPGGGVSTKGILFKMLHVQNGHYWTNWRPHSHPLYLFIEPVLKWKNMYCAGRTLIMLLCSALIFQFSHAMKILSCSSRSCMILSAWSTGTEVNNAVISYEQRHSSGWRVTLLTLSTKSLA